MGASTSIQNSYREYDAAFMYSDYLLELDSLSDIKEGWRFIKKPNSKIKNLDKLYELPSYILGFLGSDINLKANLINKICGEAPIKQDIRAYDQFKGLRMRISQLKVLNDLRKEKQWNPNHKEIICLSNGNSEFPVSFHKDEMIFKFFSKCYELGHILSDGRTADHLDSKKYEDLKSLMVNDKVSSESFIDRFICEICDIIIIVVGQITFEDQKYIERITIEYKNKKKILVIHNFDNVPNMIQTNIRIDKEIKGIFQVKETPIDLKAIMGISEKMLDKFNRTIFIAESINEPSNFMNYEQRNCIIHLIIAKEGTKPGSYYNKMTFCFINDLIKKNLDKFKEFKLTDSLKNFLESGYLKYFNPSKRNERNALKINVIQEEKFGTKFIKTMINQDIKYLTDPKYDSLGNIISFSQQNYIPHYHVIEKKGSYEILVEVPLLKKDSLKINFDRTDTTYQYLLVSGEKKNEFLINDDTNANPDIFDIKGNLEWGNFNLKIPVAPYSIRLKKKKEMEYKEGLIHVRLWKGDDDNQQILTDDIMMSELDVKKSNGLKFSDINFKEKAKY